MLHPSKILKQLGISPLKMFGQNFQVDTHVVANAAVHIPADAVILEIGPGLGAWTEIFLARGHRMVLVEKDRSLAERLRQNYTAPQVVVMEGDFLEVDVTKPPISDCTAVVGNLPFYITSELLLRITGECPQIEHGLFGVQLEVAERLAAGRGSSLAIALSAIGEIRMTGKISRHSFYPPPNVDAALLSFSRKPDRSRPHLRLLLKAAFWGKRKALGTALKKNPFWDKEPVSAGWAPRLAALPPALEELMKRRADDLSAADFCALYDYLCA